MAFDYDGTLAAITADPARAFMRDTTRELLCAVAQRYPTLVLSGRRRDDVQRLVGISTVTVVGNHGSETADDNDPSIRTVVAQWRTQLQTDFDGLEGVFIEDKGHSLSVHYRHAQDPVAIETMVQQSASRLDAVRLIGGKCVLNVLPMDAPGKGTALAREMKRIGAPRALFVGDDTTDEDAFAIRDRHELLSIRVGYDTSSLAACYLVGQQDVDVLLQFLLQ
ncbi:MAG: trehalose-phosphatase [Dokdonella sp.]